MQGELGVPLCKAGPGHEGAQCLRAGSGSTGVVGGGEGSHAAHLQPRTPNAILRKGATPPWAPLPTAGDPRKEEPEGAAGFQAAQVAPSFVLLLKSPC